MLIFSIQLYMDFALYQPQNVFFYLYEIQAESGSFALNKIENWALYQSTTERD